MRPIKKSPALAAQKSGRVLYVEDDDLNWEVVVALLSGRFDVDRARTDEEAARLLNEKPYDLILMDIELAGSKLNGIDLARLIKKGHAAKADPDLQQAAQTPLVILTAYAARYTREELLKHGADDVLFKPVNPTGLMLLVSRLLVRRLHA